jgi:large subunit ribosomal protein L11
MKKKPVGQINLLIEAGKANPAPPIGPALGQRGLNIMEFCKRFNDECTKKGLEVGLRVSVVITYFQDKTFVIEIKQPPVSVLVTKYAKLKKGSSKPGFDSAGKITKAIVRDIAVMKLDDMGYKDFKDQEGNVPEDVLNSAIKMVEGTCRSMGVEVVE